MEPYAARLVIRRHNADAADGVKTTDAPFEARWVESDGQLSKPFGLTPPLSAEDAADLRWYLEKYHEFVGAGTRARAHQVEAKLDSWGRALFDAAFGTVEGTNVYRNLLEAERKDRPVLLTLGTIEHDILVQPWELMRDVKGPLAFRGVSIRRQLEGAKPMATLELRLPLRLLLIVSRPTDSGFIDPRTSVRPLLDGLDRLPKGSVEVQFCEPPTLGELEERIARARKEKRPFHIVHFDGHGTYAEADARYEKALDLARQVNDLELQGTSLQHQGVLSHHRGDLPRSVELFEQAIGHFQQAGDQEAEMQTYDLLASTERLRGHLDAAEAWYARSRELAEALGDRAQLAANAQNVGILFQTRAEQAEVPAERDALLRRAVASIETSLAIWLERNDQVGAASSHFQVGVLHRMLGDLDRAEEQLLKGLEIVEPLNLPDLWKDYGELARVAEARGDAEAAAAWAAKRDAKREELRRLAGGGSAAFPEKVAQAFLGLAQAVYAVRTSGGELPAEIAEVLAQLAGQGEPLASAGLFLRAVAEGGSPPLPSGLPEPLAKILGGLLASLG